MRNAPTLAAVLAVALAVPAVVTNLEASQDAPKVAPPSGGQLSAAKGQFMRDGTPIKVGEKISLFNGKDTKGWKAFVPDLAKDNKDQLSVWSVKDGVLQCAGRPIGYIQTEELFDNFVLELDWRFDPAKGEGNSGVLLRTIGDDVVWPKSMEAQLHSKNAGDFWNIGEYKATVDAKRTNGRHTVKLKDTNEKPLGEWNHYRIVVNKGTIELWVNGLLQNVATDVEVNKGRIALQSEGAYIEFKDIVLHPIVP
jgi:hypothetical protein